MSDPPGEKDGRIGAPGRNAGIHPDMIDGHQNHHHPAKQVDTPDTCCRAHCLNILFPGKTIKRSGTLANAFPAKGSVSSLSLAPKSGRLIAAIDIMNQGLLFLLLSSCTEAVWNI